MELVILLILQLIYPIIEMSVSIICIIIIMISYLLICQDKPEYQEYQVIIVTIIPISILNVF